MAPAAFVLALLFAQEPPSYQASTQLNAALQQRAQNYNVTESNFVDALIEVAGRFKVPMGIAWVREPSELKPIHLSWSDATVEQVVRDIVRTQPGYEVEVRNAVVHVRPRDMIPDKENFLRLRIPRFDVQNEVAEIADRRLAELVNLRVTPPKPPPPTRQGGGVGFEQGVEVGDPEISISLSDASVEDVLDAISLASPFKVWIATFAPTGDLTQTGFRRTVSPITAEGVPHSAHPYWESLKWGRAPY